MAATILGSRQHTALPLAGGTLTGVVKHTNTTTTPSGASPSATIDLNVGNHQILACTSATGTIGITLTVPTANKPSAGTILVKIHATTATGITFAASSGTLYWLGTQPTWTGLTPGKRLRISWAYDGTDLDLAATDVNS